MNHSVLVIGLIVGAANFLFRYLPLRLAKQRLSTQGRRGWPGVLLDTIGIASICALLVVSSAPDVLLHPNHLLATLCGFAVLGCCFWKTRSVILPTLCSAVAYGLVWKLIDLFW